MTSSQVMNINKSMGSEVELPWLPWLLWSTFSCCKHLNHVFSINKYLFLNIDPKVKRRIYTSLGCRISHKKETMKFLVIYLYLFLLLEVYSFVLLPLNGPIQVANCDFENGLCPGYELDTKQHFQWLINNGTTSSQNTGPEGDHTIGFNGQGNYIYMESSNRLNREKARFQTHALQHDSFEDTDKLCLVFHYHMYGHTMGDLRVFVHDVATGVEDEKLHLSGNQGSPAWERATVPIDVPSSRFKIVIEGTTSYGFYGDIAIDDIKLSLFTGRGCYFWPPRGTPRQLPVEPTETTPLQGPENSTTCGRHQISYLGNNHGPVARLIGGTTAPYNAWPWMAMLQKINENTGTFEMKCGGTLLGTQWIVTAAHCVVGHTNKSHLRVRLGAHDRVKTTLHTQDIEIDDIYVHRAYRTKREYNNDVAIIKLKRPAMLNQYVRSICLQDDDWEIEADEMCYVTGWGKLWNDGVFDKAPYSQSLQQGKVPIRSHANCTKVYGNQVTENMICAGNENGSPDTCLGDSGGPLLCSNKGQWQLVGITSWGHQDGCGYYQRYGVYTSIKRVRGWIRSVTNHPYNYRPLHYSATEQ